MQNPQLAQLIGLVFIVGFAIQQFLQILDVPITWVSSKIKAALPNVPLTEDAYKKSVMVFLGSITGWIVAYFCQLDLLSAGLKIASSTQQPIPFWDCFVSGLVLGSGTEAANTFLKYISYIKDNKAPDAITTTVTIQPSLASVNKGATLKLAAIVKGPPMNDFVWTVMEQSSGASFSDSTNGILTTPATTTLTKIHVLVQSARTPEVLAVTEVALV